MSRILVAMAILASAIIVIPEAVQASGDVRRWTGLRTMEVAFKQPLGTTMQVAVITEVTEAVVALAVTLIVPHPTVVMDLMWTSRLAATTTMAMVIRAR